MSKKTSRILAALMSVAAVLFVLFALGHPELGWNGVQVQAVWAMYGCYLAAVVVLFIAPFGRRK